MTIRHAVGGQWVRFGDAPVTPPPPPSGTIIGTNAGDDTGHGNATVATKLSWFGRIPMNRWYYGLNGLPATFNPNMQGGAPEKRTQVSFKWNPAEVIAGQWDARFDSYFTSAPADWSGEVTPWHEPNKELSQGQFTIAQYKGMIIRLSTRLQALGLTSRWKIAPNFTAPYPQLGISWSDSWMMTPDQLHPGATWTWDAYGNLYGGLAYDSPYRPVAEVLDPVFQRNAKYGWWPNWGITEFNTPRRNHDLTEVARAQWLQDYVDYCLAAPTPPKHILLWEGSGQQFDQFFKTNLTKNKWAAITATSA